MPARIPLPSDDELTPEHRELLANMPALNVFRMLAGMPKAIGPFMQLGGAVLSTALDARRREMAVLRDGTLLVSNYASGQLEAVDVASIPGG